MSHVLLGGDERELSALRILLTKWGVTAGRLAFGDARPTVQDCDAVIFVGQTAEYRDACLGSLPDGSGGAAGPAAPLIIIGNQKQPGKVWPDYQVGLPQVDDDGGNLRAALVAAFASAKAVRGGVAPGQAGDAMVETDSYLHFLGHELRSPLTALKTSLEVLQGELGGLESGDESADVTVKMLAIALRNVRRLHRTVEWSQDLLAASEAAGSFDPREVALPEMAARLCQLGEVEVADALLRADLQTDPELLMVVITQMIRTVEMAAPERSLRLEIAGAPDDPRNCLLIVAASADDGARPHGIPERLRLVGAANAGDKTENLERLARFMVADDLVAVMGAKLMTLSAANGCPALALRLALTSQAIPA